MASTLTVAGVVDITDTTDSSDATGDTGALRTEGGASIAKKLYVGTDLDVDGTTNLDVVDIDGAVDMASTLQVDGAITNSSTIVSAGKITADAGIDIDNFNIDGTTIALSSGNLTVDVAGDIVLDAGGSSVVIQDDGTGIGRLRNVSSDFIIKSEVSDKDLIFQGNDGGSAITALTLDMSAAGAATFNDKITAVGTSVFTNLDISGDVDVDGTLETDALTVGGAAAKVAGKESIYVPATAMYPSTTNGCASLAQVETTALRPDLMALDFATGADEFAQFSIAFPKSWNEGTVTFQPFWTVTGTNTGTVAWGLSGIAVSSDDSINTAFGTTVVCTALAHSGTSNDLMMSVESGAVTIAGSPAANDMCFFQVTRDVSADNQSGDARLLGIKLFFTTDAANDA